MSVQAAVAGDVELLKLAVLHDPLVGAICSPDEVWQMVDEMLVAQAEWLPQYADAIPAGEAAPFALDRGDAQLGGRGAPEVRTIDEVRREKEREAEADDDGLRKDSGASRIRPVDPSRRQAGNRPRRMGGADRNGRREIDEED